MRTKIGAGLLLIVLVASGCGTEKATSEAVTVQIDGTAPDFNGIFTQFFPNQLTVHPGSSVVFRMPHFHGDPHTVTLGTLVDAGDAKVAALGAHPSLDALFNLDNTPEFNKLTDIFFHKPPPGPPSPNQSAAQPCFLDSGAPPNSLTGGAPACPKATQPAFSGKQTYYNSGVLFQDDDAFTVKLSKDIEPGSYAFMCMIHRANMRGTLTVVPLDEDAQTAAQVTSAGRAQLSEAVTSLQPAADALSKATGASALAAAGADGVTGGEIAEFAPKQIAIPVGGKVSWSVNLFHNIALNPPEGAVGAIVKKADGSFEFNPPVVVATNSPQPPPIQSFFPAPKDAKDIVLDGGPWDGKAFRNSGLLASLPREHVTYSTTFTQAGTYTLRCLIHPDMKGTVKVG